jgi:hypothetical protein
MRRQIRPLIDAGLVDPKVSVRELTDLEWNRYNTSEVRSNYQNERVVLAGPDEEDDDYDDDSYDEDYDDDEDDDDDYDDDDEYDSDTYTDDDEYDKDSYVDDDE